MLTRTSLVSLLVATALLAGCGTGRGGAHNHLLGVGSPRAFGPGQFWYTRTISLQHEWLPAGGTLERPRGYFHPIGPKVLFDLRISDETWVGVDGTIRERMMVAGARFASAAGRAEWERTHPLVPRDEPWYAAVYRRPMPDFNHVWLGWMSHDTITIGGNRFPPQPWPAMGEWVGPSGWDVGDSLFSYRQLVSLPRRPAALRARLKRAEVQLARRENRAGPRKLSPQTDPLSELSDIAGLLGSPLPARVRLAVFHAAVKIPGVRVNAHARDWRGRAGVAVGASRGLAYERLIFDPATGALLEAAPEAAVVAEGAVDSAYELPKHVMPIHLADGPPTPQTPAISPAVGNPSTVFRLSLTSTAVSQRPPALDWMLIGTPGDKCLGGFVPRLAPLVASARMRAAGRTTNVYNLRPAGVDRHAWCPGRYELTVLPDYSRRPRTSFPSQSILLGLGSSIYFRVDRP